MGTESGMAGEEISSPSGNEFSPIGNNSRPETSGTRRNKNINHLILNGGENE